MALGTAPTLVTTMQYPQIIAQGGAEVGNSMLHLGTINLDPSATAYNSAKNVADVWYSRITNKIYVDITT